MDRLGLLAFGFPFCFFIYFWVIGWAVLALCYTTRCSTRQALIAPTIGLAVIVLLCFLLNHAGFAVKAIAGPVFVIPFVLSFIYLLIKRPLFSLHDSYPFLFFIGLTGVLVGWPLLRYGFHWYSYFNEDMTNYCLAAMRFYEHGFFAVPTVQSLSAGTDYTQYWWFFHVGELSRSGSEMLLAFLHGITTLDTISIFMPVIVLLQMMVTSAAAAVLYTRPALRGKALALGALMSVSALTALGSLYQLIAQVGGLSLLLAALFFLLPDEVKQSEQNIIQRAILLAIIFSTLIVFYTEFIPFLGVAFLFYTALYARKVWPHLRYFFLVLLLGALGVVLVMNTAAVDALGFLWIQISNAAKATDIFPYDVIPSGLATLWGLDALATMMTSYVLNNIFIFLGLMLSVLALYSALRLVRGREALAMVSLFFTLVFIAIILYLTEAQFGLFKLSMYAQPFLLAMLVLLPHRKFKYLLLVILFIFNSGTQYYYVQRSLGSVGNYQNFPNASQQDAESEFKTWLLHTKPARLISTVAPIEIIKFQAQIAQGYPFKIVVYPAFFKQYAHVFPITRFFRPTFVKQALPLIDALQPQLFTAEAFPMGPQETDDFSAAVLPTDEAAWYIFLSPTQTILNRSHFAMTDKTIFEYLPTARVHNLLAFIASQKGLPYYLGISAQTMPTVSYRQLENDSFYPGHTMTGLGRYYLFEILHPGKSIHMLIDMTKTYLPPGQRQLPHDVKIWGKTAYAVPMTGAGSARVLSPAIKPVWIRGHAYVLLDLGSESAHFTVSRYGLMGLYGRHIDLDPRELHGFGRNISILDTQELTQDPTFIERFPQDLTHLFYSGINEQGELSSEVLLQLRNKTKSHFLLQGVLLQAATVQIDIDGKPCMHAFFNAGKIKLVVPVLSAGQHRIHLLFVPTASTHSHDVMMMKIDKIGWL